MNKERIYNFRVEIETINDIIWFTDYDVLIINGMIVDESFWHRHTSTELKKFTEQKVSDYKFVEFENGRVIALVQTETTKIKAVDKSKNMWYNSERDKEF